MNVAHKSEDLEAYLTEAAEVSMDCPVVISKFILEAKEIEVDAVALRGELVMHVVSEHVENAGVHSGDATLVLPPQDLDEVTVAKVVEATRKVANALSVTGPMNIQFIAKDNEIKVIECNLRAARSFPFVSKTIGLDLARLATRVMLGHKIQPYPVDVSKLTHVGVKMSQFSFNRLLGADPILGVEMASTGEIGCFGSNREEAFLKCHRAVGGKFPEKSVCISIGMFKEKLEFLDKAKLLDEMGYTLYATPGTADFFHEHGLKAEVVVWPTENEFQKGTEVNIIDLLKKKEIGLLVLLPSNNKYRRLKSFESPGYLTRRAAIDFSVPLITNIKVAKLFVNSLQYYKKQNNFLPLHPSDARFSSKVLTLPGCYLIQTSPISTNWTQASADALSGGFTSLTYIDDNVGRGTSPESLRLSADKAKEQSVCDFTLLAVANRTNQGVLKTVSDKADGLFMYPESFDGSDNAVTPWMEHFNAWTKSSPIFTRSSGTTLAALLFSSFTSSRDVHVCEVRSKEDIGLVAASKSHSSIRVTCDVNVLDLLAPLHESKPRISQSDRDALWESLDIIDAVSGPPGLVLPLLLSAERDGRITRDWLKSRLFDNPKSILRLPDQPDTYIEVDLSRLWTAPEDSVAAGASCQGKILRVVVNGMIAYMDDQVYSKPGAFNRVTEASPMLRGTSTVEKQLAASAHAAADEYAVPSLEIDDVVSASNDDDDTGRPTTGLKDGQIAAHRRNMSKKIPMLPNSLHQGSDWIENRRLLSVKQFTRQSMHVLFNVAYEMRQMISRVGFYDILRGKVLANLFFEPSTRTQCSFQTAMQRLGGTVIHIDDGPSSSMRKGETLEDTVRTAECYADILVIRHPAAGSVQRAASLLQAPVINAGDGVGEHPTQALLDIFTIREELGTVNGITVTFAGDLKNGRTVHSLARLLSLYKVTIRYVSPDSLRIPSDVLDDVASHGIEQSEHTSLDEVIKETDVLYMTRVQKERFDSMEEYDAVKAQIVVTPKTLTRAKPHMILLHPLPRCEEISAQVDSDPRAVYFRQMEHGLYIRMAILAMMLGRA